MSERIQQLGSYRIDRELGRGGMGIVYLGHDTRLDRRVAVKALPEHLADDPARLERFEREARSLASLTHPNVAAIHGLEEADGRPYLILEYVEGETLAALLARGRPPVGEALAIARGIARGLEAAHEQGVVHRDLKPANVMVSEDGAVKILDFGLARALDGTAPLSEAESQSPTFAAPQSPTISGAILGTAGYMSPEQARGKTVDKRSDIFSFGCVLYELLTGERAFGGETVSDAIGAVLHRDPPLDALPPATPPRIRPLLERCLARDKSARYRDIGDVLLDLEAAGASAGAAATAGLGQRPRWLAGAAFVAGALLASTGYWLNPADPVGEPPRPKRFTLSGLAMQVDAGLSLAMAPSGAHLAVRGLGEDGISRLYLRAFDSLDLVPVPGSAQGRFPFFSPDGQNLAFSSPDGIKVAPVQGGAARTLAALPVGEANGGVWTSRDTVVFSKFPGAEAEALYSVPASGGPVSRIPVAGGEGFRALVVASALPGGEAVLATIFDASGERIALISLEDGSVRTIRENAVRAAYASSGHILFEDREARALMALPFDAGRRAATGSPTVVVPAIGGLPVLSALSPSNFAVADDGTIAIVPPAVTAAWTIVRIDGSGRREVISRVDRPADQPRLSHDETRVAYRTPAIDCDIWVHDLARGTTTRVTSEGDHHGIVWSADDERIATVRRLGENQAVWLGSDGAGSVEPLASARPGDTGLSDVSRDGRYAFVSNPDGTESVIDTASDSIEPLFGSASGSRGAVLSPDGRWLAYSSDSSGRSEVYVQPFPALDSRVQVSAGGGSQPVWSRDGGTLYYRNGRDVFQAAIQRTPRLAAGRSSLLLEGVFATGWDAGGFTQYDVGRDGRVVLVEPSTAHDLAAPFVEVIVDGLAGLAHREGVGRD